MSSTTKILVVDDEQIGRQLLEAILVPEGYQIFFGADGEEALKVALSELPDIILLDVMMPKKDGFETCMEIRDNPITAHIPVFLITALDDRDSRIRGIDAGADDYISKPFDRIEILAKIKNKSTQIDVRRKDSSRHTSVKSDHPVITFNETLVDNLIQTLLPEATNNENLILYRSGKIQESQNAFIDISAPSGNCFFLISNKLTGKNAALVNSIFTQFLINIIRQKECQPGEILSQFNANINRLITESGLGLLKDTVTSLPIILIKSNGDELVITGQNQSLFICQQASPANQCQFQSYYLQGNQDLKFSPPHKLILLSKNILDQINQMEILTFLNTNLVYPTKSSFTDSIKHEYKKVHDILVVELTFQAIH
jgi:DNA-binding response OmpR family regulator